MARRRRKRRGNVVSLNEKAYVNRQAFIGFVILNIMMLVAYIAGLIKQSRDLTYTLMVAFLSMGSVLSVWLLYRNHRDSDKMKYLMVGCFGVLYVFVLFTTNSILPFAYAVPLFFLVTLYCDLRYCLIVGIGANVLNIASAVITASVNGYTAEQIPDLEIRILLFLVLTCYLAINTVTIRRVNDAKLASIKMQKDDTKNLLHDVLTISNDMITNAQAVSDKINLLGDSILQIRGAMGEVSSGSTETAESIQEQLRQTESIQNYIDKVRDTADSIESKMEQTKGLVDEGQEKMIALSEQMKASIRTNEAVLRQMSELNTYTQKMNTIIETITNIANNTGMLALNAGIEAAHAGEAGKGFAVVADEITRLANQTKSATVNITQIINNINKELRDVSKAVETASLSNQENVNDTITAQEMFNGIAVDTEHINLQIRELAQAVDSLSEANADIVDKIQTISAITQQVSAHAGETYNACDANSAMVDEAEALMQVLNDNAKKLKAREK